MDYYLHNEYFYFWYCSVSTLWHRFFYLTCKIWVVFLCHSSNQTAAAGQPQETSWSQTPRTLRTPRPGRGWYSLAAVGVVWSVCQVEAPLHPSLSPVDVCWRLLWVCALWMAVGVCVHALKCCLRPEQNQVNTATWAESHSALLGAFNPTSCLFSDFASIQGGDSAEDAGGSQNWNQE